MASFSWVIPSVSSLMLLRSNTLSVPRASVLVAQATMICGQVSSVTSASTVTVSCR